MKRDLEKPIQRDLKDKIVLLSGPRQVGKTTLSKQLKPRFTYLNYDTTADRKLIASERWDRDVDLVIFDEIHKMKKWKSWIKGIYDSEGTQPSLLATGSARLETFRKGGDSLAGRYHSFRLHPLTVNEVVKETDLSAQDALQRILKAGGFPEPFFKDDAAFAKRWRHIHLDTILREDLLDLEKVRDIKAIELLVELLRSRVGSTVNYSSLAQDLQVSVHTVKHWLQILENLFVIFAVRPFSRNIPRSLLKDSKYYFYDTGAVDGDGGAKLENTVACALLRELNLHEDLTGSKASLHFLRDKEKREVDFLTLVDNQPRHLIEVKAQDDSFSKSLLHFQALFKKVSTLQIVGQLSRKKSTPTARMEPAHEFLKSLSLEIPEAPN